MHTTMADRWVERILSDLATLPLGELLRAVGRAPRTKAADKSASERSEIAKKAARTRKRRAAARKAVATRQQRQAVALLTGVALK